MTTILRTLSFAFAAVALALSASHAGAQSRATVVASPAKVATTRVAGEPAVLLPVAVVPVAAVPVPAACTPLPGYPCDAPTPLPPGAGNSCYRGNSAGVSRCPA